VLFTFQCKIKLIVIGECFLNMFQIILDKDLKFSSLTEFRRALLVGELAILTILINVFYILLKYINHFHNTIFIYFIVILVSGIVFLLNKRGIHEVSKFILLLTLLSTVFILGSSNIQDTQTYVHYLPLIIIAFTLFEYKQFWKSIIIVGISIVLFMIDFSSDFSILPRDNLNEREVYVFTITNYLISVFATLYIGFYLVRTNFLSENTLIDRQKALNEITVELQKSQHRYELAISGSNAGLWDWDIVNNKIYHGLKWKEMLGYDQDEIIDISIDQFYMLVHPSDLPRVKKAVENHLTNGDPFHIEYRIKRKDGSHHWFLDSGKAVFDENQQPVRMVGSIINISERILAEEKIKKQKDLLEKANAELDRFVYITSHDLKAPLLSIQGLINLAEISDNKEEVEHCLSMMKERVKGLENFISDIINYSRNVRSGIIKEEINLRSFVKNIVDELMYMKNVNKLKFIIDIDADLQIISDEKRLNVILKNLIFNSIKYHNYDQNHPEIIINAQKNKHHIHINVKDNGEGIREDVLNKIFDMFYRASEKSSGSGLGLYIVKEMINKLNGSIKVNSTYGIGSEFSISLPNAY